MNSESSPRRLPSHCHALKPSGKLSCRKQSWLLALAFNLAACAMLFGQADDFNDGNDEGWTRYDPISQSPLGAIGSFSFPSNNSYRIQSEPSPAPNLPPNGVGPGRVGSLRTDANYFDFYISVDIIAWDPALDQLFGITARLDDIGLGSTDGYAFTYDLQGRDLDITAFEDEDPDGGAVEVGGVENAELVPGRTYRMVFSSIGSELTGALFELPDVDNPIAKIVGTHGLYTSGAVGLLNYDNSSGGAGRTDVTYDNFYAYTTPPPRITPMYFPETRDLVLLWPISAETFILQAVNDISSGTWTNIPPPYEQFDNSFFYLESTLDNPSRFFRLTSP